MRIQTTRPFDRDYAGLSDEVKGRADKQLALLLSNPRHPSLRLQKVRGTEDIWEARISRGYRLTFQMISDTLILRRVGPHDVLKKA